MKTLAKPTRYAGVNVPDGETDLAKPSEELVANLMGRVFPPVSEQYVSTMEYSGDKKYRPLWKIFAWLIIVMVMAETCITNRIKR